MYFVLLPSLAVAYDTLYIYVYLWVLVGFIGLRMYLLVPFLLTLPLKTVS